MIDGQNNGTEQPEKTNIPQEPAASGMEAAAAGGEPPKEVSELSGEEFQQMFDGKRLYRIAPAEGDPAPQQAEEETGGEAAADSAVSEAAAGAPETVPEAVEASVPSVEEPVYPEQAAPCEKQETVPESVQPPVSTPQPEGAPFAQAASGTVPQGEPPQGGYFPQNGGAAQPYFPAGYVPGQQPPQAGYPVYYQPAVPAQDPQRPVYYQPAPQPQQGYYVPQPQPVWEYPQPPYVYGAVHTAPARRPKRKIAVAIKVFTWIASVLAGVAVLGFFLFVAYNLFDTVPPQNSRGDLPGYSIPDRDDGEDNDVPDFDDGVTPPEAGEDAELPDVDVTPNTEGITITEKPAGSQLTAQEVYERVVKSTVTVAVTLKRDGNEQHSTGTGIIATADGYIITNSHVVLNSKSSMVEITAYDGQKYDAVVVGVDRTTDLAVLKTNDYDFTPAEFGDSEGLAIGEAVVAIGNPGGEKFSGSMTGGYISGLNREVGRYSENGMTYIQTDAAINPGNSGGPLVNMYGQVVGINSSKIITDGYEGMGFAIPVSKAKSVIDVLLSGGYVQGRTRLGITGKEVSEMEVAVYGIPQGFIISEIGEESAFTGTDARIGDIITAIDGEDVTGLSDISNLLTRYAPGDKVTITLYRQGKGEIEVEATLLEDRGETQK